MIGMNTEPRPTTGNQEYQLGTCEQVRTGVPLTRADLDNAKEQLPDVREAHAESNGLFAGCALCRKSCQLQIDVPLERDRFCEAAIAERDNTVAPPAEIPKQPGSAD